VTTSIDPDELPRSHDTFGGQTPVALVAIAAIGAILLVNSLSLPSSARAGGLPSVPALDGEVACAGCGEVVGVRPLHGNTAGGAGPYEVEIRMRDGIQRLIRAEAPGVIVGDRVRLEGGSLTLRD